MTILGIETATDVCSIGILSGDRRIERSVRESRIHSEKLLLLLQEALDEASLGWKDVGSVALSSGPGSFTGLRIGASTVKGLLSADPRDFVLVSSFDGISFAYRRNGDHRMGHVICLDAKQDEWYVQDTGSDGNAGPIHVLGSQMVRPMIEGRIVLTDAPGRFDDHPQVLDLRQWCSGLAIADLGRRKIERGMLDDVRTFEPSYWKEFVVRTVPKDRTPQQTAKEK